MSLPLLVDFRGRRCLVIGGGAVATRKVLKLHKAGAVIHVIAPDVTIEIRELEDTDLHWEKREITIEEVAEMDMRHWSFVVAASNDHQLNHAVAATCAQAETWCNDTSNPRGASVAFPAVHTEGTVTLAVSTVGESGGRPGAAAWIRDQLIEALAPEISQALDLVDEALAQRNIEGSVQMSHPDWREVLNSGMLEELRAGRVAEAKERLEACLSSLLD